MALLSVPGHGGGHPADHHGIETSGAEVTPWQIMGTLIAGFVALVFPVVAFAGGAVGLTMHLLWDAIPVAVAVGAGLAGSMAVGLEAPVTAALVAAALVGPALVGPALLPLAILAVVAAHVVHLLADQLGALPAAASDAPGANGPP